ncbi:ABC transporter permease [Microvirga alba]|uniref:ABC transporter permease n=1 Tax=Microvirga alba TaxID=2791025 RepID=A0A931BU03_9HYPH|nr:ABC transporter permease [Microvirga alba]MBF9235140.1 ABC transporter permease [Microvirga alba]
MNTPSHLHNRFLTRAALSLQENWPSIALFALGLLIWQYAVAFLQIPQYLLPTPSEIFLRIWKERWLLWSNLSITMIAAIAGFFLGFLIAVGLGTLFVFSRTAARALMPWTIIIRTIPILAIAPLMTIWLGFGIAPKIAVAALACFFPILINFYRGLGSISREIGELLSLVNASRVQGLIHVRIFAAMPFTFAALKISSGLAVVGAIVAEFTGANLGIGTLIVTAGYQQDAVMLFAGIIVSCIASVLFYYVVVAAEKLCLYWPEARMG